MPNRTRSKEEDRIIVAIASMGAYGRSALLRSEAMADLRMTRAPIPVAAIAEFLEALATVLDDSARDEKMTERELSEIKAEIACVRRFLQRVGLTMTDPLHGAAPT